VGKPPDQQKLGRTELVQVVFPLGDRTKEEAEGVLRKLLSPFGRMDPIGKANRVFVIDQVGNLRRIRKILDEFHGGAGSGTAKAEMAVIPLNGLDGNLTYAALIVKFGEYDRRRPANAPYLELDAEGKRLIVRGTPQQVEAVKKDVERSARFIAADITKEEAVKRELAKMSGTWKTVSFFVNGDNMVAKDVGTDRSFVINRDTMTTLAAEKKVLESVLKINPLKKPQEIDIILMTNSNKGEILKGVYKLEEDYLTICFTNADADRPTDFTSKKGSGRSRIVYKRQKP
jgi:uncharacterized protein (TIGR03067 family)